MAGVLVVLHDFAFSGLVSSQNPDVLALWLPTHCFLGDSLQSGHIPAWNPSVMGGAPFAADPQSGWMYAPAMLLYTLLPCGAAIRWFIVLQPILAGLGVYWFARGEGLSRPAATVGGLSLSLAIAGSQLVLSVPFSAALAWTALLLAAASRLVRAEGWPRRLVWLALTALAWGQLAAAHLSNGFVLGTGALVAYLVARGVADARTGRRSGRDTLTMAGLLLVTAFAVNLAFLLPRLAYLPRTTLWLGYDRLLSLSAQLSGMRAVGDLPGGSIRPTLPLRYVASPGVHLGAVALALSFAGWRARRHRHLVVGFAAFGLVCYVLSMQAVAEAVAPTVRSWPLGDFYLREPGRFALGLLVAIAVLAAIGLDAWREARYWRERASMLLPAVAVWIVLPLAFGADRSHLVLSAYAAGGAAVALALAARRPAVIALVPVALAAELVANGLSGQDSSPIPDSPRNQQSLRPLYPLLKPDVDVSANLRPGPIARALQREDGARYVSLDPGEWDTRGLHVHQDQGHWGLMATQRSMLFHIEEAQGYNATQEKTYWTFTRSVDPRRLKYNAAYFEHGSAVAFDLLDVGWIVGPADRPPDVAGAVRVAEEGRWALFRIPSPARAQFLPGSVGLHPFDVEPVLHGTALGYRWTSMQHAVIHLDSPGGHVLIRNTYDPNWHAIIDGSRVPVSRAGFLLQAVTVPPGKHTVELCFNDPWIGFGLLGSGLSLALLLGSASGLHVRARRRRSVGESPPDADRDGS